MPIASIFNYIGVIVLVVLVLILVVSNIHVVQQSRAGGRRKSPAGTVPHPSCTPMGSIVWTAAGIGII